MISNFLIANSRGKVLLRKSYRPFSNDRLTSLIRGKHFGQAILESKVPHFQLDKHLHFLFTEYEGKFLVAVTERNVNVCVIYTFLSKLKVLFSDFDIHSFREDFMAVHDILDEVIDYGYPQISEYQVLQNLVSSKKKKTAEKKKPTKYEPTPEQLSKMLTGERRGTAKNYSKNEVFIDIEEEMNALVAPGSGKILHAEVRGRVKMKPKLSGSPEICMGLAHECLSNVKIHHLGLMKNEGGRSSGKGKIVMTPPDKEFEVMSYHVDEKNIKVPIRIHCMYEFQTDHSFDIDVFMRSSEEGGAHRSFLKNILVTIPLPSNVSDVKVKFKSTSTKKMVDVSTNSLFWKIPRLEMKKVGGGSNNNKLEKRISIHGKCLMTTSGEKIVMEGNRPLVAKFEVGQGNLSPFRIKFCKVHEAKLGYFATKWVKYAAKGTIEKRVEFRRLM